MSIRSGQPSLSAVSGMYIPRPPPVINLSCRLADRHHGEYRHRSDDQDDGPEDKAVNEDHRTNQSIPQATTLTRTKAMHTMTIARHSLVPLHPCGSVTIPPAPFSPSRAGWGPPRQRAPRSVACRAFFRSVPSVSKSQRIQGSSILQPLDQIVDFILGHWFRLSRGLSPDRG